MNIPTYIGLTDTEIAFLREFIQAFPHVPEAGTIAWKLEFAKRFTAVREDTPEALMLAICKIAKVTPEVVSGPSRKRDIADIRAVISVIVHDAYPQLTTSEIGLMLGRDHSTIIHHFDSVKYIKERKNLYWHIREELRA